MARIWDLLCPAEVPEKYSRLGRNIKIQFLAAWTGLGSEQKDTCLAVLAGEGERQTTERDFLWAALRIDPGLFKAAIGARGLAILLEIEKHPNARPLEARRELSDQAHRGSISSKLDRAIVSTHRETERDFQYEEFDAQWYFRAL